MNIDGWYGIIFISFYERGKYMTFYDLYGKPIAYTDDDEHIYLFGGEPVAYFSENKVYGYNGHHLGWFENGWIRDKKGECVFFTENASGSGPVKPVKKVKPVKSVKRAKPVKSVKKVATVRPVNKLSWSELSGEKFFMQ